MVDLRRTFLTDLGTKAIALVLALAVYVHVLSVQEREMVIDVPLVVAPLPLGLSISNDLPSSVRVQVRASGRELLKLRTHHLRAEVRLETPRPGALQRPILGSDVLIPKGVKVSMVEVLDPQTLDLNLEATETMRLPVALILKDDLASGSRGRPREWRISTRSEPFPCRWTMWGGQRRRRSALTCPPA